MENCTTCGVEMKLIPAGVSKKPPYKPYNSFLACPNKCKQPPQGRRSEPYDDAVKILGDEIINLRAEVKKLSRYIVMKLETPEERQIRMANEPTEVKNLKF